ncbi:hypothetical protein [uncultured Cyclobacterium sp.]|uniref:hypothetical protein n=1 Tax=uncultured Cyclobacterium sp. TaxID=453820 RepID=UPI0030EB6827
MIIKNILNLDDRETVFQITENIYPALRDKLCSIFLATVPISKSHPLILLCL